VALTVFGRVTAAAGGALTPYGLLALSEDALRTYGLSRAKAHYLHDLARRQAEGIIDLEHTDDVGDTTALADLTAVRGVGEWSAQMFLVHQLRRPDILPAGDVGIRRAVQRAWQLTDVPGIEGTRRRALPWSPNRTYAAALLWASLATQTVPKPQRASLTRACGRCAGGGSPRSPRQAETGRDLGPRQAPRREHGNLPLPWRETVAHAVGDEPGRARLLTSLDQQPRRRRRCALASFAALR
jgi:endonuclease III